MMTGQHLTTGECRVQFDFEIDFSNGGGIQGQGFRLDIDGDDICDEDLAIAIVGDLRLLMVSEVRISNKQVVREPHKRSRVRWQARGANGRTDIAHRHSPAPDADWLLNQRQMWIRPQGGWPQRRAG